MLLRLRFQMLPEASSLLLTSVLFLSCAATNGNQQPYFLGQTQKLHRKMLQNARDGLLLGLPFCYYSGSRSSGTDYALESNMTWPQFLQLTNGKGVLEVQTTVMIYQLVEVDEKSQTVTMILSVFTSWRDCRLGWIPENYGNFTYMLLVDPKFFRDYKVYRPNLDLMQSINMNDADDSQMHIAINPDGKVSSNEEFLTTASCSFDIEMYPFDTHTCKLTFVADDANEIVRLQWPLENLLGKAQELSDVFLTEYTRHDQWTVTILPPERSLQDMCPGNTRRNFCNADLLTYSILLRRNPKYLIVNLFLPAFVMVLISGFIFVMPPGCSDKMALNLTNLLAMYMFSQLLYGKMPETGSTLPLLSQYFMICIGLSSVSCLYSAFSAIFTNARPSVPTGLRKVVVTIGRFLICDIITSARSAVHSKPMDRNMPQKSDQKSDAQEQACTGNCYQEPIRELNGVQEHNSSCCISQVVDIDADCVSWTIVVALFDRLFFLVHMLITSVAVGFFFTHGYGHWANYGGYGTNRTIMEYVCAQAIKQGDPNAYNICMVLESLKDNK